MYSENIILLFYKCQAVYLENIKPENALVDQVNDLKWPSNESIIIHWDRSQNKLRKKGSSQKYLASY